MITADTPSFKLGTRGSPLALAQARMTAAAMTAAHGWDPGHAEIVVISTTGDRVQDRPLAEIGGKALWTKELDAALIDGRIDCGVHSMKDVETQLRDGIALVAMLPRADVRERLIGADSIDALPQGARIGTSSPRRAAQLQALRPDLVTEVLRGNVATRMAKVESGAIDATLLAAAGLDRLGIAVGATIETDVMLPASAQGAVGITARAGDEAVLALLAAINDADTFAAVSLERGFLAALGGTCHSPVAALATITGDRVAFRCEIMTEDGSEIEEGGFEATLADAPQLVAALAADMLADSGPALRALFHPG
ncbi:hydroxymethylbilane synthase [Polymorphobacter fuscus]|uniref:Porphobilinogen deaminase n=1 Tax=Sandarakinorhabdus fusca TaxID=1439888 RepID=A0A7C9GPE3_9SPHN|nr:hydroxymethylbilane synthase [Polymorphobacter fuscus]KAB7647702.1 hydroxymethylbilane synthase [Polymorphobacter fuscus]MQT16993.1 hydroxymethylbilane synthase [Polymorphobacter fuscus]NJC09016.1 hydroxymethylbilane synthase [Polymorphobacter fuscus]